MSDTFSLHKLSVVESALSDVNNKLTIRLDVRVEADLMKALAAYMKHHRYRTRSPAVRELLTLALISEGFLKDEK
jgi:metal-responsive CopG/Arc/MetJ family transcriptional regulator